MKGHRGCKCSVGNIQDKLKYSRPLDWLWWFTKTVITLFESECCCVYHGCGKLNSTHRKIVQWEMQNKLNWMKPLPHIHLWMSNILTIVSYLLLESNPLWQQEIIPVSDVTFQRCLPAEMGMLPKFSISLLGVNEVCRCTEKPEGWWVLLGWKVLS